METFHLSQMQDAIVQSVVDAIVVINERGSICFFSPSAEKLFGYTQDECLGQNVNMLMPEPFHGAHDGYLHNYVSKNHSPKIIGSGRNVSGKRKDGSVFSMHLSVGEAKVGDKRYFVGTCHDLTEYEASVKAHFNLQSMQNALLDAAVDGIIAINDKGIIQSFNRGAEQLFGYQKEEVIGSNIRMLMPSSQALQHDGYLRNYSATGKAKVIGFGRDVQAKRKDGSLFPMHISIGQFENESGKVFVGVCHDLSEFKNALQRLMLIEQRYNDIVENQKEFIFRLSSKNRITYVNKAFTEKMGQVAYQMLGIAIFEFVHPEDRKKLDALLEKLNRFSHKNKESIAVRMLGNKREESWVDWTFSVATAEDGTEEIQGVGLDITEQVNAKNQANYIRSFDTLTGLLNKEGLVEHFERLHLSDSSYVVFYMDCHRFRLINEKFGQDLADLMLIEAGRRMQSLLLPLDSFVCRPGSDDYIMVVKLEDKNNLMAFAQHILDFCSEPYWLLDQKVIPSVFMGISIYPDQSSNINVVIRQAESAMFEAKRQCSPIRMYHSEMNSELTRQLEIEQGLIRALQLNLLTVVLQPKYELNNDELIGYEALLRWNDPVLGTITPDVFVAVAEAVNLGKQLDCWVIKSVLQQIKRWKDAGLDPKPVAVNITAKHFSDPALYQFIMAELASLELPASCLQLEITEGVAIENTALIIENLNHFRKEGIKIAIDDFGTGYSSLSYLASLPIDFIKIDRSFVQALDKSHNFNLVKAMLAMAKAINVSVIAEGIESKEQQEALAALGCEFGQGYLYSKPVSFNDIESVLIKRLATLKLLS